MARQRIMQHRAGKTYVHAASCNGNVFSRKRAYNYASLVLFAIIVEGAQIFLGTEQDCKNYAIELRKQNVVADWVKA